MAKNEGEEAQEFRSDGCDEKQKSHGVWSTKVGLSRLNGRGEDQAPKGRYLSKKTTRRVRGGGSVTKEPRNRQCQRI